MTDCLAASSYVAPGSKLILVYCERRDRATTTDSYEYLYPQLVKIPHRAIKVVDSDYLKNKSWEHKTFLLVLPGGIFSRCEYYLEAKGILKIINFAKNFQGRIFGICSWAYGLSQKSSYINGKECLERDRSGSPFYLSPTFARGPIKQEVAVAPVYSLSDSWDSLESWDSWESASFDGGASATAPSGVVQIYSCRRDRTFSSPFTRFGSTDSLDSFFTRFSPSPPPSAIFTSDVARCIQIWRPDGTSGSCHYLNGAKLTPLTPEATLVNFASFDKEGAELAIVGYTPNEGGCPGNLVLSSVHPEYTGESIIGEPGGAKPLSTLFEELSTPDAKKFNQALWDTIISYFQTGDDPA
ncbi:MAG: hypothetical protein FJZ59_00700 [Chlamydiae bacterium]|nr:hypothetical protein [Chlamydiota bacterium]